MATEFDHTIEEPLSARLRLRADLRIERRQLGGRPCYVIEDPIRGKFYRLGVPEFTFAALLNGTRTVRTAIREVAEPLGELAFKENEALTICHWLLDAQLVENPAATEQRRLTTKVNERPSRLTGVANPLSIRIPILNPSKVLTIVEPWLVWTLRTPCFLAWLAFLLYAAGVAAANWHELVGGTAVLLDRAHCWLLFAAWLGLKLLHETYHAIVCRKYGGTAPQAGVFLLFFAPVPYVDVTSSWRFASKWQRIATAAAGMYIELFMAALAVVVWANNMNGTVRHVAISIAAMASLGTIVINANPLMRFDGYFIFADLLDIPNLNTYGRRWLRATAQRLLGCPDVPQAIPPRLQTVIKIYSIAAVLWRALVCGALLTALMVLVSRLHPLAAVATALFIAAGALRRGFKSIVGILKPVPMWSRRRLAFAAGIATAVLASVCYWLLGPATIAAPAVVDYFPLCVVRSATPGFVKDVYVRDGGTVSAGEKLFLLENRELAVQLKIAELDVEKSIARCRSLRQAGEIAREQAELSQQAALVKKRDELSRQMDALVITAPAAGKVLGRRLDTWLGRYVEMGTELLSIGEEDKKEFVVAVSQEDVELFQNRDSNTLAVCFSSPGLPRIHASDLAIDPRATTHPPHEALSSRIGGPLAVTMRDDPAHPDRAPVDELLDPCFKASLPLSADQSRLLRAGVLATVEFRSSQRNGAWRAFLDVRHWFERRMSDAQ